MSKNKGANYERKIAKDLSKWWGGTFSRVPASGGLHWGSDQRVAGDIVPPPEVDFPFVVECKKREEWVMDHIVLDIGQPREWWAQVVMDGRRVHRTPIMFFSRNHAKDFVMAPYSEELYTLLKENATDVMVAPVTIENIRKEIQQFEVIVTTFDTLSKLPIDTVRKYGKEVQWDPYRDKYE